MNNLISSIPECSFCHSVELELLYSKADGVNIQCIECGYSTVATNEHLSSEIIISLAS